MDRASRRKEQRREKDSSSKMLPSLRLSLKGFLTRLPVVLLLLSVLATLIYSNTFSVPFLFDDNPNIALNPQIKDLGNFFDFSGNRHVGFLSFALNYYFGGLHVFGYHLANLLIHIVNAFLVYSLVLLLFQTPASALGSPVAVGNNSQPSTVHWIALATALLFVAHPIQTQAVTYIVQRFSSLVTLFYLLAVACYLKWRLSDPQAKSRYLWYAVALLSTILAMKTKENSFTLPLMILLLEAVFFRPFTRKRWISLLPFLLTLLIIPASLGDALGEAEGFARETTTISRPDYLFTQFRVIMTYLRLLFLPINQNLDYDYPVYHSLFHPEVFLSFLFLLSLLGLAIYLLFQSQHSRFNPQLIAFGILWFFLTLSIESSIIPIRDVIFEHRLYLPSVGFFLAVSIATVRGLATFRYQSIERKFLFSHAYFTPTIFSLSLILIILSVATYKRNAIWNTKVTLWEDVVRKAPNNYRGHDNLGASYYDEGRLEAAIEEFQIALKLRPGHAETHNNLGASYYDEGRLEAAIEEFQIALKLRPGHAETHNNLGNAYADQGDLEEAIRAYQAALKLRPDFAKAHYNLGISYVYQGHLEKAIRAYQAALKLRPDFAKAHNNLGAIYADQGHFEEAIREYKMALKLRPDLAPVHNHLGKAYAAQGRLDEAIMEYQTAIQLKPDSVKYNNLGVFYSKQRLFRDAVRAFQAALQLNPTNAEVRVNLGMTLSQQGRRKEAREEFQRALQHRPDYEKARKALEALSQ